MITGSLDPNAAEALRLEIRRIARRRGILLKTVRSSRYRAVPADEPPRVRSALKRKRHIPGSGAG